MAYADTKALWHIDRLAILQSGGQPTPVHWMCSPMGQCNQSCHFCAFRMEDYTQSELFGIVQDGQKITNPKRMIPLDKMLEVIEDWQTMGTKAVTFTGGGEPLMHPDIDLILQAVLNAGIEVGMITNGALLRPKTAEILARASWVRVSLDCDNADTYSTMRQTSKRQFYAALDAIKQLVTVRDNGGKLTVNVHFVVTKENWLEVVRAARLAKSLGVNTFRISAIFQSQPDYFEGWGEEAELLCQQATAEQTAEFQISNNFSLRSGDTKPDYERCWFQHFTSFLGDDLNVYRCCVTSYTTNGLVGSIKNQRLVDLWKQKDYSSFDARSCNRCSYNQKNRLLELAIQRPNSENFV